MATYSSAHSDRKYDRDFLLSPEKRNQVIELWEVEKYGRDCFNDPDHVHLYGMAPKEWYARGVRILARTCLEAVKDPLGNKIGSDIAEIVKRASGNHPVGVVDPFAGSCNGLYAMLQHLPGARGIGFEIDPVVFDLTTRNIALSWSLEVTRTSQAPRNAWRIGSSLSFSARHGETRSSRKRVCTSTGLSPLSSKSLRTSNRPTALSLCFM
jgi:hypothetical protein